MQSISEKYKKIKHREYYQIYSIDLFNNNNNNFSVGLLSLSDLEIVKEPFFLALIRH